MPIIKLDAIDSTNDYLKQLAKEKDLENFTIVMAREQTKGRGQMGAKWYSEPGKNLTMSVLVKDLAINTISIYDLNVVVAMAAVDVLTSTGCPNVKIKWPNDIMADNKKVGGILIENSFKTDGTFTAVVGFGLNLNQTNFEHLPQASSLTNVTGQTYDLEATADLFVKQLKLQLDSLPEKTNLVWNNYEKLLFKRNKAVAFEDSIGNRFMGIIESVTRDGKLALLQEDDLLHHYEVKAIKMLY
ncbi:biotin--[acetyl-CoA-carboxylase] ligase [Flavobacterium sp.]|uniref:biotin--[acetyl-CoA-carboxylase] ligase n=1 Tax=Flavobacterium sp. TaxID=239 RepID=UPI002FD94AAB